VVHQSLNGALAKSYACGLWPAPFYSRRKQLWGQNLAKFGGALAIHTGWVHGCLAHKNLQPKILELMVHARMNISRLAQPPANFETTER